MRGYRERIIYIKKGTRSFTLKKNARLWWMFWKIIPVWCSKITKNYDCHCMTIRPLDENTNTSYWQANVIKMPSGTVRTINPRSLMYIEILLQQWVCTINAFTPSNDRPPRNTFDRCRQGRSERLNGWIVLCERVPTSKPKLLSSSASSSGTIRHVLKFMYEVWMWKEEKGTYDCMSSPAFVTFGAINRQTGLPHEPLIIISINVEWSDGYLLKSSSQLYRLLFPILYSA